MKASYKKTSDGYNVMVDNKHKANVKKISAKLWGLYDLNGHELSSGKTRNKAVDNANLLQNQSLNLDPDQAEMLLNAIQKVSPVLKHNNYSHLPVLKNILIYAEGDQVKVVAADGHRMHSATIETKIKHLSTMLLNPRNKHSIRQCILTGNNKKESYRFIKKSIKDTITACSMSDDILIKKSDISTTYTDENKDTLTEIKDNVYQTRFIAEAINQIEGDSVLYSNFNTIGIIKGNNFMAFIAQVS